MVPINALFWYEQKLEDYYTKREPTKNEPEFDADDWANNARDERDFKEYLENN